ncbi:MAG TPA: pyridoxamine 5'-phosphate oxidase family protein [Ktedonobacteraceae bacterium]|nr:pyridoxamine 5'-phosphate oxidase family protein [Ktedonobacteraceae bacterium]
MEPRIDTGEDIEPESNQPRMFGGFLEPVRLPWKWATERLTAARNYWIATTRPNGHPHSRPVWGVWLDDAFYFSTGSLAAKNLAVSPAITIHLESGSEVVIIEGFCQQVTDTSVIKRVVYAYNTKYHWNIDPNSLPGPFYVVRPIVAFGWLSDESGFDGGAAFHGTATRWRFGSHQANASS